MLHEVSMALQADHVAVLARGRIVHHGAAADPTTPRLESVFDHRIGHPQRERAMDGAADCILRLRRLP